VYKIKNNAIYETSYMFQYSSKSQFKTEWSESHIFTCIKVSLIYEQMFNIIYTVELGYNVMKGTE